MGKFAIAFVLLWGATRSMPAAAQQTAPTHVACVGDSSPDANARDSGAPDAIASPEVGTMSPQTGAAGAPATAGGNTGGSAGESTRQGRSSGGCSLAPEGSASSVPPVVCLAFAMLTLARRRRPRGRSSTAPSRSFPSRAPVR
jgi:hypothetical protein